MSRRTRLTRASTEVVGEFIDPEPGGFKYDIVQDAQGQQSLRRRQRDSGAHHRESDQGLGHGPPNYAGNQSIRLNRQRCGSCDLLWALTEGAADKGSQFKDGVDFVSVALGTHSLAFVIADILCDIVISEGDSHEVGSAEDSDAEEGMEMTSTPRRDASKASKPGYAPVANQSTPAQPARGEPAWSEPSPVKASYLADGQSADASLSGTQVRAPPPSGRTAASPP